MKKTLLGLLIAGALTAHAQTITWGTPTTVSGASDVSTAGTYFGSWAPGNGNAPGYPVNGVTFEGFSDLPGFNDNTPYGSTYGGFGSPSGTSGNYATLLNYGFYAYDEYIADGAGYTPYFQWGGMVPGGLYEVQFWVNDSRSASDQQTEILNGGDINAAADGTDSSGPLAFGGGAGGTNAQYITGTFTAGSDGSEEILLSGGTDGYVYGNLVQVRTLLAVGTPTASPAANAYNGESVTLSAVVGGDAPSAYQWLANGTAISGATSSNYQFTAYDASPSSPVQTNYSLTVVNDQGSFTSAPLLVTINPDSPASAATNEVIASPLFEGNSVTLSYSISGAPPVYVEWELNGTPIGAFTNIGADTTTSLVLTNLQSSQGGVYTLIVSNSYTVGNGTASAPYDVTVKPYTQFTWFAPQPITTADAALELFGGATNPAVVFEATGFGGDPNGNAGTPVTLDDGQVITFEQVAAPGYSPPSGSTPGQVATGNGTCYQGDFGTYTGTTGNSDFDDVLNGTDNGIMANLSSMTISNLTPGTLYGIQIFATDDRSGNGAPDLIDFQDPDDTNNVSASYLLGANDYSLGMFVANATCQTVDIQLPGLTSGGDILDAAVIYSLPLAAEPWDTLTVSPSTNVFAGTVLTISEPLLTGLPPFTYQWQANGVNLAGATNSVLTITVTNASQIVPLTTNFDLVVANGYGTNATAAVSVTINPAAPPFVATNEAVPSTLFSGNTQTLSFAVNGTPPLWAEWELNGTPIGTFTNIGEAGTASLTLTDPQPSQSGIYTVIITNKFGVNNSATNSQEYSVTVEPYPQFTWFAPEPITTADAALELFDGPANPSVVFEASDFAFYAETVTLDDGQSITFQPEGTVDNANGGIYYGGFSGIYGVTNTTGNADLDNILSGTVNGIMASPTAITFLNLTPGTLYGLQIFSVDDRAGNGAPDLVDFQDPNDPANISPSFLEGANDYALGTFVANSTNQTVTMQLPGLTSGGDILNAAVLYSLPLAAEAWDTPTVSPSTNVVDGTVLTISEPLITGLPPFAYQWQANGVNLAGATNSVLTTTATNTSLTASVVVNYALVVGNSSGTNTSPAIAVTITPSGQSSVPLSVSFAAGSVTVSWPTGAAGYVLQTTTNLTQSWTTVPPPYTVVGGQYQMTESATTGTAFFRLLSN